MSCSLWPHGLWPHQAPLSMGFSRQEYWSRVPFPSSGDLPNPGIEPSSPALAGRFFTQWATRETLFPSLCIETCSHEQIRSLGYSEKLLIIIFLYFCGMHHNLIFYMLRTSVTFLHSNILVIYTVHDHVPRVMVCLIPNLPGLRCGGILCNRCWKQHTCFAQWKIQPW